MARVKEDEIQKWLEKEEVYQNIAELITNQNIIEDTNNHHISSFSLDYIVRNKILESSKYVYENLSILDLVVANKNISINKQERLYPDLLLFNAETATFIIVEIKRSDKAEREAITELLAYEHELQNLFPFMSKIEVCFVLISADYKPLLEHSIYSLILWQNRKVLSLKIEGIESTNNNDWKLSIHIPNSWSLLSTGHLKPNQINTIHLVLYDKDAYDDTIDIKSKKDNLEILQRGLELIVKEGEKNNASGFVLLLEATQSELANWEIVIGVLNPHSFLPSIEYESKIKDFFKKEYGNEIIHTKSTIDLGLKTQTYLKIFFNPMFEGMSTWDITKKELQQSSNPILVDFFGEMDNVVNTFVLNKTMRDYFYPELNEDYLNWKNPLIGLNILDNTLGDNLFFNGEYTFINLYKFGKIWGMLHQYLNVLKNNVINPKSNPYTNYFVGKYKWIEFEFIKLYREISLEYSLKESKENNILAFIPLKNNYYEYNIDVNIENINAIARWLFSDFLTQDIHKLAFDLGINIKNYFYDREYIAGEEIPLIENLIVSKTQEMINLEFEQKGFSQPVQYKINEYKKLVNLNAKYDYSEVSNNLLIDIFETHTLPLFSSTINEVYHKKVSFDKNTLDIEYIKEVYPKEYEKNKNSIISLTSNGNFGIILATDELKMMVMPLNPKKELMFLHDLGGSLKIVKKLTWEEFESKEF